MAQDARSSARLSFTRDLPLTQAAIAFAEEHHDGQRREADGASFLVHPLEVASLLERSHYPDYVVAAAVLHDVLEDTDAEPAELEARFGREVAELVELVSDDPSITDEERRKDDVRELRMLLATGLDPKQAEVKLRRYRESLAMMEQTIPSSRVTGLLRFELEALENLPPRPPQSEPPGAPRSPS